MSIYQINRCSIQSNRHEILKIIEQAIQQKQYFLPIVTINITMFHEYKKDLDLYDWLIDHALFIPDGISISFLIFKRYFRWIDRTPGIDLVTELLTQSSGYRVAMVGASQNHLEKAVEFFNLNYSNHELVFSKNGFHEFSDNDWDILKNSAPDIVLIAMGCPRQDIFMRRLANELSVGVAVGVGGMFDVWAGSVKRAPKLFRLIGLEWLYRIILQPVRIFRIIKSIPYLFGRSVN